MKRTTSLVILVAALALVAAGCGDDEDGGETETVTVSGTDSTTATTQSGAQNLSAGSAKRGPAFFSTPSENIGCHISTKGARCDIRERTWKPPPEPKSCKKIGLDYGQGIFVGADHAEFICAGDTALGAPTILPYGATSRRGAFRCRSGQKGVTCSHAGNGHGFFLSRQNFRVF
jgi:hypothetical protein